MIYNYTRCESVIAKIMADLNLSEKNVRITDIKEWIFEAVDKIGAPTQYEDVESGVNDEPILRIVDKQVMIPRGLQFLNGIAYSPNQDGPWYVMRKDTGIFHKLGNHKFKWTSDSDGDRHFGFQQYEVPCLHEEHHEGFTEKPTRTNADVWTKSGMKYYNAMIPKGTPFKDPTYFIKPGWIVTNMDKGYLKLSYKRQVVDEKGYPYIPDLASYQEAVYWYVVMKLQFPKFLNSTMVGKNRTNAEIQKYNYIQQQWYFYRNQAYAECMMPDAGEMRSIKNDWNKLIPDFDGDDNFFRHIGDRQTIINDYYYGY